ncbi:MAG TPA: hypothetical protein VF163_02645, partial [Micromonosporaceae bacterium]
TRHGLSRRQRLLYGCVQFYYPSVAMTLLLGNVATALYLLFGIASIQLHSLTWLALWALSLGSWFLLWFWLRRFNLAEHERVEVGMPGMALALFAGPVYAAAAWAAIRGKPLTYAVTAKGKLSSGESLSTFRLHLAWAAGAATLLGASFVLGNDYLALRVWAGLALLAGLGPPVIAAWTGIAHRFSQRTPAVPGPRVRATAPANWVVRYHVDHSWNGPDLGAWHDRFVVEPSGGVVRQSTLVVPAQPASAQPPPDPALPDRPERIGRVPARHRPYAQTRGRS